MLVQVVVFTVVLLLKLVAAVHVRICVCGRGSGNGRGGVGGGGGRGACKIRRDSRPVTRGGRKGRGGRHNRTNSAGNMVCLRGGWCVNNAMAVDGRVARKGYHWAVALGVASSGVIA